MATSYSDISSYISYPKLKDNDIALIKWKVGGLTTEINTTTCVVAGYVKDWWQKSNQQIEENALLMMNEGVCATENNCQRTVVVVKYDGSDAAYSLILQAKARGAVAVIVTLGEEFLQLHPQELYPLDDPGPLVDINIPIFLVHVEGSKRLIEAFQFQLMLPVSILSIEDPSMESPVTYVELVSAQSPSVYIIHNLLPDDEVQNIKGLAKPFLRPSYIGAGSQKMRPSESRTSNSTFLLKGIWKNKLQRQTSERISQMIGISTEYFADLQVNFYQPGGQYEPHYDWVPHKYQEQVITALLSLSTQSKEAGGETIFPSAQPPVKVHAKQGMALVFNNTLSPGNVDRYSWHGGAPLISGTKWNANQWILNKPVPLSRKVSIPTLLIPYGGDPPDWMMNIRNWATRTYGGDEGYLKANAIFNGIFFAVVTITVIIICTFMLLAKLLLFSRKESISSTDPNLKSAQLSGLKNKKD